MIKNTFTALIAVIFLSGCTQHAIQNPEMLRGKSIAVVNPSPATLNAVTGGSILLLGPLAEIESRIAGDRIMRTNNIPDPAISLSQNLSRELAKVYGFEILNSQPISAQDRAAVKKAAQDISADLALSVQTTVFNSIYHLTDANNYKVTIIFNSSIIDSETNKEIAWRSCKYSPKYASTNDAPKWDYLYENGAMGIKNFIKDAQNHCVDEFLKTLSPNWVPPVHKRSQAN